MDTISDVEVVLLYEPEVEVRLWSMFVRLTLVGPASSVDLEIKGELYEEEADDNSTPLESMSLGEALEKIFPRVDSWGIEICT